MNGFSESIQTRYKKLKKGEKREDHNQDGISIKLKFFKNIHSKDKNALDLSSKLLLSNSISKDLKKWGFKFIGPTICYAYLQAIGMINDHENDCFRYNEIKKLYNG